MSGPCNATAWALACRLLGRNGPTIESALSDAERVALAMLVDLKAVKGHKLDARFVLCPYCQLLRGVVVQGTQGLVCECPDCGPVPVEKPDSRAWVLDADWLVRKLRGALDIPPQQAPVAVTGDVWRLGIHQRHPVILARSLDLVLSQPTVLARAGTRSANPSWVLTPKPLRDFDHGPFEGRAVWLPLEERFALYGGNLHFIEPGQTLELDDGDMQAVNGPFSADFRWVHLADRMHGPIALSEAQAAVFKALWHYKGMPQQAESIMTRAGFESAKPIDVFKVKRQNKGDPQYEGPYHAYRALVDTDRRAGTYAMPCSASVTA